MNTVLACNVDRYSFVDANGYAGAGMFPRADGNAVLIAYRLLFNYNGALEAKLHVRVEGVSLSTEGEGHQR